VESPTKERLTGALILVAVLVIIVPEMLSGPDKPLTEQVKAAASPEAGAPLHTYNLDLGGGQAAPPTVAASAPGASETAPEGVSETPAEAPPIPAPAAPTEPVSLPPVVAQLKPSVVAIKPATTSGAWWVQLGSFSTRANAERLAGQLRGAGFSMQVSAVSTSGKELFRVRAGPATSRDQALDLQTRLTGSGHKGSLVAP
jgi:DedD protein